MNPAPHDHEKALRGVVNPTSPNWHYVYLLKGKKDGTTYIGATSNLHKRIKEHEEGKNYATKKILPVELIYFEAYRSKTDAFIRAHQRWAGFIREKHLKYYSSGLRNLKIRLQNTLNQPLHAEAGQKGGAG